MVLGIGRNSARLAAVSVCRVTCMKKCVILNLKRELSDISAGQARERPDSCREGVRPSARQRGRGSVTRSRDGALPSETSIVIFGDCFVTQFLELKPDCNICAVRRCARISQRLSAAWLKPDSHSVRPRLFAAGAADPISESASSSVGEPGEAGTDVVLAELRTRLRLLVHEYRRGIENVAMHSRCGTSRVA